MSVAPETETFAVVDGTWLCRRALTLATSDEALKQSARLPLPPSGIIRFSDDAEADSAALAVMLALFRRAEKESRALTFRNVPQTLKTLARVYGVDTLLLTEESGDH
ncbi:MAG: STAS domain-containing protein [Burkholderiales bacterium]|jgi:phospholipid transport system transporter-binding protein|nr:STAS domain-containing protein [Burkholderiales bacterium]